jgi:gamma-glutamylcyclotransferase (GGCT)/AIG2-like uncharacterized protein YtfP
MDVVSAASQRLAVYGTLAPGEVNHHVLEPIRGCWSTCVLRGAVDRSGSFPVFHWDPSGEELKAHLLESPELPNHWDRLDLFEGPRYKRRIVPAHTETGIRMANVYVAASP